MSEMTASKVVKVGEVEVIVRELSVADVRALISAPQSSDLITEALFKDMRLSDIPTFTSLSEGDVEIMRPSELSLLIKHCREMNPDFFGMLDRLMSPSQKR